MCRFDKESPWGIVFRGTSQSSRFSVPRGATGRPAKFAAGLRLELLYHPEQFAVALVWRRKNKGLTEHASLLQMLKTFHLYWTNYAEMPEVKAAQVLD